VHRASKPG